MADQHIRIDTDVMGTGLSRYTSAGNAIQAIFYTLKSAADQYYGSWGADSTGESFAQGYLPSAQQVLDGIRTGANAVIGTVQGIVHMMAGYTDTEDTNIQAVGGGSLSPEPASTGAEHGPTRAA